MTAKIFIIKSLNVLLKILNIPKNSTGINKINIAIKNIIKNQKRL